MNEEPMISSLSVEHLDYLQRAHDTMGDPPAESAWTFAPAACRRLSSIRGVGRFEKQELRERAPRRPDEDVRPPTQDLLSGLHGYKIPIAFLIQRGAPGGVSLSIGTWEPQSEREIRAATLDRRLSLVEASLDSIFATTEVAPCDPDGVRLDEFPLVGLATGTPTAKAPDRFEGAPIDRLIAAMGNTRWAALIVAQPVDDEETIRLRRTVLNEIRTVQSEEKTHAAPSPLAQHYADLLTALLKSLTLGFSIGTWRTAAYLFGDRDSYYRLATLWRAVHSGEKSLPEPLRVRDATKWPPEVKRTLAAWGMPDAGAPPGPGRYRHPFAYQTLLSSQQLASYIDFPLMETAGFSITEVPVFDTEAPSANVAASLSLGNVVSRRKATQATYPVDLASLTKHTLVAGITGSGKTNTIFRLLREATAAEIPFLVLEPAKAEYRSLLEDPAVGNRLRVLTAGDERVSPLRLNPFEVPKDTTVAQHLDLLRSVFAASFGMWTPLPQVLERCLHEIYTDYGWNLATNSNARLGSDDGRALAFPTLSDLVAKVAAVVPRLGYEDRVTSDIAAALITRLDGLRRGGKGRMLDTRRSIPMSDLVVGPTVVELERMGDDDDKAFLMALLLVRLYEHRRAEGDTRLLRHLLVIEEAHRLLSAAPQRGSEEQADPRGKAVETFSQLLSEIRAYGQGVIVADQVPVRLIPDVLKNTGLKIAHRTVAAEDRAALAGAMAMDERQARSLTTLGVFEAATFGGGDDAPILVRVPLSKGLGMPSDEVVEERMSQWRAESGLRDVLGAEPFCEETCEDPTVCDLARRLAAEEALQWSFGRIVLSTIEETDALDRLWEDLLATIRARRPAGIDEPRLLRSLAGHLSDRHAGRRGAQAGWSFAATEQFSTLLRRAMLEKLAGAPSAVEDGPRERFQSLARSLAERDGPPYPACDQICAQSDPPICLYRHAVADVIATGRHRAAWQEAFAQDVATPDAPPAQAFEACQEVAYQVIEFPEADYSEELRQEVDGGARRASLCYAQQMLAADPAIVGPTVRRFTARLVELAGIGTPENHRRAGT